jgi:hypothetical protein
MYVMITQRLNMMYLITLSFKTNVAKMLEEVVVNGELLRVARAMAGKTRGQTGD